MMREDCARLDPAYVELQQEPCPTETVLEQGSAGIEFRRLPRSGRADSGGGNAARGATDKGSGALTREGLLQVAGFVTHAGEMEVLQVGLRIFAADHNASPSGSIASSAKRGPPPDSSSGNAASSSLTLLG